MLEPKMSAPNSAIDVLRSRRSVGQPRLAGSVIDDHGVVRDAIESARWAPNHKYTEPWRFYLLDDARIERLAELNAARLERNGESPAKVALKREQWAAVPGVVIITVRSAPDADELTRREDYAAVACAAQNFMLHLWAEGIASKWSTAAVWHHEGFWPLLGHDAVTLAGGAGRAAQAGAAEAPTGAVHGRPAEEVVGIFFYGTADDVPAGRRRLPVASVLTDFRA